MDIANSILVSFIEHGPMDDETVIPWAAADDQTEHKQCKFLFFRASNHFVFEEPSMNV